MDYRIGSVCNLSHTGPVQPRRDAGRFLWHWDRGLEGFADDVGQKKSKKRKNLALLTQRGSYYWPYISANTAKYNTSAHKPITAAPASHATPSKNQAGISKNRS